VQDWRKGGEKVTVSDDVEEVVVVVYSERNRPGAEGCALVGGGGGAEKASGSYFVSRWMRSWREAG
jgi:hypothetical protein